FLLTLTLWRICNLCQRPNGSVVYVHRPRICRAYHRRQSHVLHDARGNLMITSGRRVVGLAIVAAVSTPALAQAQETATPPRDTGSSLETVVVTGSAITGGVKKLEASYNIVTANEDEIRNANPKSTADLLKISPGLWPESTGGQTG